MSSMHLRACIWLSLLATGCFARRFTDVSESATNTSCGGLPHLGHISERRCGEPAWGTLVVGCVSAKGLKKVDYFSESDPFCRVRLSDRNKVETRGFWNRYGKYQAKSSDFNSRVIKDEPDPVWKESFAFNFMCPQVPRNGHHYQVEVTLKDEGWTKNEFLGVVYESLDDIMTGEISGEKTYDLEDIQRADNGDSRKAKGDVKLVFKWCGPGDNSCVQEAWSQSGMSSPKTQHIDCDMSCSKALSGPAMDAVNRVAKDVDDSLRADRLHDHYKDQEERWDDIGDHAEDTGNHHLEEHADMMEDRYDDLEDHYEDEAKKEWNNARRGMASLSSNLARITESTCGSTVASNVAQTANGFSHLFPKKFKDSKARQARSGLRQVEQRIKNLLSCMDSEWKRGNLLTNTREAERGCYN